MPLNIIRNNIVKVSADAIVNTANPEVAVGAGVDQTIYEAAGFEELLAERAKIGPMRPGQAAATPAFALDAKYIIHTVGPVWCGGDFGEREAVASCYRKSLQLADELKCESIAFPLISTGTYGFPKDQALKIAISEISDFLFTHEMMVYLVVYDREAFVISGKAFSDIRSYIEEEDVKRTYGSGMSGTYYNTTITEGYSRRRRDMDREYLEESRRRRDLDKERLERFRRRREEVKRRREQNVAEEQTMYPGAGAGYSKSLDELLNEETESFQDMLFRIIDRKGLKDPEVYKKANLDRKLFSKIRSSKKYLPQKKTVLALAIALELNMDETLDLMRRAGITLNPNNRFDKIVAYCIRHKIYNIYEINTYLFEYDEPTLGADS